MRVKFPVMIFTKSTCEKSSLYLVKKESLKAFEMFDCIFNVSM